MVCLTEVEFDFGTCALILVVFLVAAPRTCLYCLTASVHCGPIIKALLAAHWSFITFVSFSLCLFSGDFLILGGYFSLEVSESGVVVLFLVFIQVVSCTFERL